MVPDLTEFGYAIIKPIDAIHNTLKINNIYNFYQGLMISNEQPVFIKEFPINYINQNIDEKWQELTASEQEESLLKSLDHPRLSKYIATVKTDQAIYVISEFIDFPSLAKLQGKFTAAAVKKFALSMLEILIYLQRQKPAIIHGQILPENILIDQDFNAYLINFSLNQSAPDSSLLLGPQEKLDSVFNITSDLYNLGLICLTLLTGKSLDKILKLSDKYYVFPVKKIVPSLSELFIMWFTQILAPSQDKRFENAMAASGALRPIPVLGDAAMLHKADTEELRPLKKSVVIVLTATTIAILSGTIWISRGIWLRQHSPEYQQGNPPSQVFLESDNKNLV
jgi:serine/threonine protein kinase